MTATTSSIWPGADPGPIREAACWVHARRPFFAMADLEENARRKAAGKKEIALSPIAIEVVRRIDALFEIERSINGKSAEERLAVRQTLSRPLVDDLQVYMREQAAKLSRGHDLAKAINYILKRWASFTLFLEDGRVCLSNNAAERGLRGIALGQKVVAVLRVRSRRTARRRHVQPDRHGQDERRRSAGLAGRCPLSHRHPSRSSAGRAAALELDASEHQRSPLKRLDDARQQGPSRHHHHPVAEDLGEDEDWLWDVANEMEIEDGVIWVYGVGEDGVMAFTDFGIENLIELVRFYKQNPGLLRR